MVPTQYRCKRSKQRLTHRTQIQTHPNSPNITSKDGDRNQPRYRRLVSIKNGGSTGIHATTTHPAHISIENGSSIVIYHPQTQTINDLWRGVEVDKNIDLWRGVAWRAFNKPWVGRILLSGSRKFRCSRYVGFILLANGGSCNRTIRGSFVFFLLWIIVPVNCPLLCLLYFALCSFAVGIYCWLHAQ